MLLNPVLRGFCPDPSIIRVGENFYAAVSTFEWWPGVRLYHSRDLKHWQQLPSPLNRKSQLDMTGNPNNGGIWAPCLSFSDGLFFLVYTDVKSNRNQHYNTHNYLVWTDNISGDWSEPLYLNSLGFDPSLFHDSDGKKYLVGMYNGFKGIFVQEYDHTSHRLLDKPRKVYPGTNAGYTEGPHLYKHDGKYCLICAEGGTGYNHQVTAAYSDSVWGPYKTTPNNPILTSVGAPAGALQKAGHASLFDTPDGKLFLAHLCSRPLPGTQCSVLGRETALQRAEWSADGFLQLAGGGRFPEWELEELSVSYPQPPEPARDDFDGAIPLHYSFPRTASDISVSARKGWLSLYGRESMNSFHNVTLAARRQTEYVFRAETLLDFNPESPEQAAGLVYMYNTENAYALLKTADDNSRPLVRLISWDKGQYSLLAESTEITDGPLHMYLDCNGTEAHFSCGEKTAVGGALDATKLSDEYCRGFTGAHIALYCHDMTGGRRRADFDYLNLSCRTES